MRARGRQPASPVGVVAGVLATFLAIAAAITITCSRQDDGDRVDATTAPPRCRPGLVMLEDGACRILGDYVNTGPDCAPVACQAWSDYGRYGDGGNGAIHCAAACEAHCAGDTSEETDELGAAREAGVRCRY